MTLKKKRGQRKPLGIHSVFEINDAFICSHCSSVSPVQREVEFHSGPTATGRTQNGIEDSARQDGVQDKMRGIRQKLLK